MERILIALSRDLSVRISNQGPKQTEINLKKIRLTISLTSCHIPRYFQFPSLELVEMMIAMRLITTIKSSETYFKRKAAEINIFSPIFRSSLRI